MMSHPRFSPITDVTDGVITIGVLTPHLAAGPGVELPQMAPGRVATLIARISAPCVPASSGERPQPTGLRELASGQALEEAAADFALGSIDVIGYASTSSAYTVGFDAETEMVEHTSRRLGLPVASTCRSAVHALRMLDVKRVAFVHPPWFDGEINDLGASYFESQSFIVVTSTSFDLPNDPSRIEPGAVAEWISRNLPGEAEAVFIGGNGFLGRRE